MSSESPPPAILTAHGLYARYRAEERVLNGVELSINPGTLTVIVGANGCGKSTLLLCLAKQLSCQGKISVHGEEISRFSAKRFARNVAFLPQNPLAPDGVTVRGLVERGREPHRKTLWGLSGKDHEKVEAALRKVGLWEMKERMLQELSGGQKQRAWIAMTLAQNAEILLLDEPTSFLDLAHQVSLLGMCRELSREGHTLILVLHDLNLAAAYADEIVLVHEGRIHAHGTPQECLNARMLRDVFSLTAEVIADPKTSVPVILPRTPESVES